MTTQHHKLVIIGSGAAGCSAAIYAARAGLAPAMIRGMQPGGQLTITTEVENYPGFADAIEGPWLMQQMEKQAENCGTQLVNDFIKEIDVHANPKTMLGESGTTYTADAVIIATGASAKWLGMESEAKFNGRGVSACATCDGAFYRNQKVAVIGGGNSAKEEALYLANICDHVTLVHRRDSFRGEQILTDRVLAHDKITVKWDSAPDEILGDEGPTGGVTGMRLKSTKTGATEEIDVHGVFVAIGHKPNTDIFKNQLDMDETGYLDVTAGTVDALHNGQKVAGVFAAGDVADNVYRQAVTAAGMGCMAALDVNRYLDNLEAAAAA